MFIKMNPFKLAIENIKCTGSLLYGLNRQHTSVVGFMAFIMIIIFAPLTMLPIMPIHRFGVKVQEMIYQSAYIYSRSKGEKK